MAEVPGLKQTRSNAEDSDKGRIDAEMSVKDEEAMGASGTPLAVVYHEDDPLVCILLLLPLFPS